MPATKSALQDPRSAVPATTSAPTPGDRFLLGRALRISDHLVTDLGWFGSALLAATEFSGGESATSRRPIRVGLVRILACGFLASACRDICPSRFTKCCACHETCTLLAATAYSGGEGTPNQRLVGDRFGLAWFGFWPAGFLLPPASESQPVGDRFG